jgi:pimeloyl-ACP methyl ester carboxylesterase
LALLAALLILAASLPLAVSLVGCYQIMYPRRWHESDVPPGGEAVAFPASDGVTIRGWVYRAADPRGFIVYGPGRGRGLNGFDFRYVPLFNRNGYSLLMFDGRGQGASDGIASMGALEWRDFLGAAAFLNARGVERMGFCGPSQGASAAIKAAARCPAAVAVVAECPYASWEDTVYRALGAYGHVPEVLARPSSWIMARMLQALLGFDAAVADPLAVIGRIAPRAILLIYGPLDPYIPASDIQRLFDAAGEPRELWTVDGAGHTEALTLCPEEYERRVIAFFDRWLAVGPDRP